MNLQQTKLVLGVLYAAFPSFYKDIRQEAVNSISKLWQEMFADDDFSVVMAAVKSLIATKVDGFPPTIGSVKEQIEKMKYPNQMTEMEAWDLVNKACRNSSHHAREEFEKLPEVIQKTIGSPDQLRVWAQMDEGTVNSVIASNFMRTFKVKQSQQKEINMIPNDVKTFLESMSSDMQLKSGEDKRQKSIGSADRVMIATGEAAGIPKPEDVLPEREPYKVPDDDEWEKMRYAALKSLGGKSFGA